jgi:ribosomal protein S11
MAEMIINASNVSQDVLLWLHKGTNGYMIERRSNTEHTKSDYFRVSEKFAKRLQEMPIDKAWTEMETHCLNTGF